LLGLYSMCSRRVYNRDWSDLTRVMRYALMTFDSKDRELQKML